MFRYEEVQLSKLVTILGWCDLILTSMDNRKTERVKYARKHKTRKTSNEVEWLSIM